MSAPRFELNRSVLVVIDVQPRFLNGIWQAEKVVARSLFLAECARLLGVPVIASEQNPERMGGTDSGVAAFVNRAYAKMAFSCGGCESLMSDLAETKRPNVILCGIETHICVTQTALDLQEAGYRPTLALDAVSARDEERHHLGVERMRQGGVSSIHSEALVYEWMQTAEHPQFKQVLELVKR